MCKFACISLNRLQLCCRVRLDQWVNLEVRALQDLLVWQDLPDLLDLLENKDLREHQEKQGLRVSLVDQVIRDQ